MILHPFNHLATGTRYIIDGELWDGQLVMDMLEKYIITGSGSWLNNIDHSTKR